MVTKKRTVQNPVDGGGGGGGGGGLAGPNNPGKPIMNAAARLEDGNRAFADKQYDLAVKLYLEALSASPEDPAVLTKVGMAYYKLRDYKKAIEFFGKVLEKTPDDRNVLYTMGLLYMRSGDKIKALSTYDKLRKIHVEKAEELYKEIYK